MEKRKLAPHRERAVIATKFGFDISPDGQRRGGLNSRPEHIKQVAEAALKRLKTEVIDLFYHPPRQAPASLSLPEAGSYPCQLTRKATMLRNGSSLVASRQSF